MPLLTSVISSNTGNLIHVAFADYLTGVGKIHKLIEWWKNVLSYGPYLGYYVNESKSWLIMREEYIQIANETFRDYNIKITTDEHRHLGAVVGLNENREVFVIANVSEWVKQLELPTKFACTEPHAAFSGFIYGLRHRYTYFMRSVPGISHLLKPLDDAIDTFIKVMLQGYTFNPTEHVLFSLPAKYGGMGLISPSEICQEEYENSRTINKEATSKIMRNEIQFQDNRVSTAKIKSDIKNQKKELNDAKLQDVTNNTSCKTKDQLKHRRRMERLFG